MKEIDDPEIGWREAPVHGYTACMLARAKFVRQRPIIGGRAGAVKPQHNGFYLGHNELVRNSRTLQFT